jgi:hypothetical protein
MPQVIPKWCGSFFGSDFSFRDCEILTIQHIPAKLLKLEVELMNKKWFDYRRMHPLYATNYFMECYKMAYREFTRIAVDSDRADFVKPIKGDDFLNAREKLSIWRLRQLVDSLGIRYDFFLTECMLWYTEECFRRQSLYPPRPGQMGDNEEMIVAVMMRWEEECATRLQLSKDTWYKCYRWHGDAHQKAYENFIVAQIRNRQHKRFTLCASMYEHNALRIETARIQFGDDLVDEAMKELRFPE